MDKRGLSDIVVTILIILLAIAGTVLIWSFIRPLIFISGSEIETGFFVRSVSIVPNSVSIDPVAATLDLSVRREAGTNKPVAVVVIMTDIYGVKIAFLQNNALEELEVTKISINYGALGLLNLTKIEIYPIYSVNGKDNVGPVSDSYIVEVLNGNENENNNNNNNNSSENPINNTNVSNNIFQCNDWIDDDGDGLIDMADPGCFSASDMLESDEVNTNNFKFSLYSDGLIKELNWTGLGDVRRVIWDEKGRFGSAYLQIYPHTDSAGGGWSYKLTDGSIIAVNGKIGVVKTLLSTDSSSIKTTADSSAVLITDTIRFNQDTMYIISNVTNKLTVPMTLTFPIQVGGLQFNDSERYRFRPSYGGYEQQWITNTTVTAVSGSPEVYPYGLGTYSPISALWDSKITVGEQFLTKLYLPTQATMTEYPKNQFSENMKSTVVTDLKAGESKIFVVAYKVSGGNDWRGTLQPYKTWFDGVYGTTPSYCPQGPFTYLVGQNAAWAYNWTTNRYINTSLESLFGTNKTTGAMTNFSISLYGVWGTALNSVHLTDTGESHEFNPTIDIIDPNLDGGKNATKITEFINKYHAVGKKIFWFARPCDDIVGAKIQFDSNGNYQLTKGSVDSYVDLRDPAKRDAALARMDFFASRGIDGFYLDAMYCPGDEDFLKYARDTFKARYGKDFFFVKEGAKDRDSLLWPQIPHINLNTFNSGSQLIQFLVPEGTYYGGGINNVLNEDELDTIMSLGYEAIPIYSLWSGTTAQNTKTKQWVCQSYANQIDRFRNGCLVVTAPSFCCTQGFIDSNYC